MCLTRAPRSRLQLLGDVRLQHAAVTPVTELRGARDAEPGAPAAAAALAAVEGRCRELVGARRAYAHALHLDPCQGEVRLESQ